MCGNVFFSEFQAEATHVPFIDDDPHPRENIDKMSPGQEFKVDKYGSRTLARAHTDYCRTHVGRAAPRRRRRGMFGAEEILSRHFAWDGRDSDATTCGANGSRLAAVFYILRIYQRGQGYLAG